VDESNRTTADRVALRHLVDAYATGVDHRDIGAVTGLFTATGRLVAHFHVSEDGTPVVRTGRPDIAVALEDGLRRYVATTHVVGGQVVDLDGDTARGETTCLAHHIYERRGETRLLVMAVRYDDAFMREDGVWRFEQRELRLDWRDDRPVGAP
jgi:hypothetical protein